jgi:hypothetical protein
MFLGGKLTVLGGMSMVAVRQIELFGTTLECFQFGTMF